MRTVSVSGEDCYVKYCKQYTIPEECQLQEQKRNLIYYYNYYKCCARRRRQQQQQCQYIVARPARANRALHISSPGGKHYLLYVRNL